MTRLRTCAAALASSLAFHAAAQGPQPATSVGTALPAPIVEAIKAAALVKTIYPVTGTEYFDGSVLKADEIVFSSNSRLVLRGVARPWIAIVAQKIKFADVEAWSRIERDMTVGSARGGELGGAGSNGPRGRDDINRTGEQGGHGGDGGTGGTGATQPLPHIYIIAREFTAPDSSPLPGFLRLSLVFPGIDGGQGGRGGNGGNGGRGGNGKEGATSAFDCKEGGGPGGNGGNGGRGGQGGRGGDGGSGAGITYVSLAQGIELLSYAKVLNVGGEGGLGGTPGSAGNPGGGGNGGRQNGWCSAKPDGTGGATPNPPTLGNGPRGAEGSKGTVTAITVTSFAPLY
jgi:hypothetical protein